MARIAARFRRTHGLTAEPSAGEWLRDNRLGQAELAALMEVLALVDAVGAFHETGLDAFLPAELQRRGRFASVASSVLEKRRALAGLGLAFPSPEDLGTTREQLVKWYEARFRRLDAPLGEHAGARRMPDLTRFVREILAEYVREGLHLKGKAPPDA